MPDKSILNENYHEWPELDYVTHGHQWKRNIEMFERVVKKFGYEAGQILYPPTKSMYEYVKNVCIDHVKNHPSYPQYIWKPKICDVGCGGGYGANIMSQEADFVWGIDVDPESIKWANTVFARHKNNIYYCPQLTFETIDVRTEPREIMAFDMVTCFEVIEHVNDYESVLKFIKKLCKKDKKGHAYLEPPEATIVYISSPNRNYKSMGKEYPRNKRHVREWTPDEFYAVLTKHFKYVTIMDYHGNQIELNNQESPHIFCKCEVPIQ
jgi:2-polyprenyl-3-methyl-5-hydroxy-6-metoxy-1,4-benzoquinol methylase